LSNSPANPSANLNSLTASDQSAIDKYLQRPITPLSFVG
jgi:hypothetical protein